MTKKTWFLATLVTVVWIFNYSAFAQGCCSAGAATLKPDLSLLNQPAPNFEITDLNGQAMELAALKGRVVLLEFCTWDDGVYEKYRLKQLKNYFEKYGDKAFTFVGVAYGTIDKQVLKKNLPKERANVIFAPGDLEIAKRYKVKARPTTYLIDKSGRIVDMATSYVELEKLGKKIPTLLADSYSLRK